MTTRDETAKPAAWKSPRVRWLTLIFGGILVIGTAWGVYWDRDLRYSVYTDDAYVSGNVVQITPQISGTVVGDRRGRHAIREGRPAAGAPRSGGRQGGTASSRRRSLPAPCVRCATSSRPARSCRRTCRSSARISPRRRVIYARRARLSRSGAISAEELQHASDAVSAAQAALAAAQQQLAANRAWVDGTTIESNPAVRNAAAGLHAAYLTYVRTVIPAPVSGFVARRDVQLGERVSTGTPLMSVVPLDEVWVDANFKESQLGTMRVGQPVTLVVGSLRQSRRIPRPRRRLWRRNGRGVLTAAGAERHRQLDQDRAARAGARCARSAGARAASAADRPVHEGLRQRA